MLPLTHVAHRPKLGLRPTAPTRLCVNSKPRHLVTVRFQEVNSAAKPHKPDGSATDIAMYIPIAPKFERTNASKPQATQKQLQEDRQPSKPEKRVVADTSDEDSVLPEDPIDLDEEIIIPQKPSIRPMYDEMRKSRKGATPGGGGGGQPKKVGEGEEALPGSHEAPNPPPPTSEQSPRTSKMADVERDVTEMGGGGELPSAFSERDRPSLHQDLEKKPCNCAETGKHAKHNTSKTETEASAAVDVEPGAAPSFPPREERAQHELHRAQDIEHSAEESHHHHIEQGEHHEHPVPEEVLQERLSNMVDTKHTTDEYSQVVGTDTAVTSTKYSIYPDAGGNISDATYFKANDGDNGELKPGESGYVTPSTDEEEEDEQGIKDSRTVLNALKQRAADHEGSMDRSSPISQLNKNIADIRNAYEHHHRMTKDKLESQVRHLTFFRILEVTGGRSALVGVAAAFASELWYRQSVLSQLLGCWDGRHQVEMAVPEARSWALGVIVATLLLTSFESLVATKPAPAVRWLGVPRSMQLWIGRGAMAVFTAIILYETMHSNRPLFPFWYIIGR